MADQKKHIDEATGTELKGHEWDGIQELDTPMPRWWMWTLYATIVWSLVYMILYPAWPLVESATQGVLGWSSRGQLEQELAAQEKSRAAVRHAIAVTPVTDLPAHPDLMQAAVEGGRSAFKVYCVQCHGSGATGKKGYPNLNDDDWLWGGDLQTIEFTLTHGVRQPGHDETRFSQMPAFGRDQMLDERAIADVASYVRFISGQEKASTAAKRGAAVFADNCVACHGPAGKGTRAMGAPNLADPIWLYGGDSETIAETVRNSRFGVMPAWGEKLDPVTIRMLAAYVHSLGGGENMPQPQALAAKDGGDVQP